MKSRILLLFLLCISISKAQDFQWVNSISGASARGMAMVTDPEGNLYVTGNVNGLADFDPGPEEAWTSTTGINANIYLVKYDPQGNYLWHIDMGGSGSEIPKGLAIDHSGNLIIVGRFNSYLDWDPGLDTTAFGTAGSTDGFVATYQSDGSFLWAQPIGGSSHDEAISVAIDELDNIYVCGWIGDDVDFDNGVEEALLEVAEGESQDAYLLRYSPDGDFDWVKGIQGNDSQLSFSVAYGQAGDLYVHGFFSGDESVLVPDSSMNISSNGSADTYLCKYDTSGTIKWAKTIGGEEPDVSSVVRADGKGYIYIMGEFNGTVDLDPGSGVDLHTADYSRMLYFSKLDTAGNAIWSHAIHGNNHFDGMSDIVVDHEGSVFLCSAFFAEMDMDVGSDSLISEPIIANDLYLVKYDSIGDFRWSRTIHTLGVFDTANGLAVDSTGNVFITGGFGDEAIFDSLHLDGIATGTTGMVGYTAKYGIGYISGLDDVAISSEIRFLSLFPNPSLDLVYLRTDKGFFPTSLQVFDSQGKLVHSDDSGLIPMELITGHWSNGIYTILLKNDKEYRASKLIIEH